MLLLANRFYKLGSNLAYGDPLGVFKPSEEGVGFRGGTHKNQNRDQFCALH